MDQGRTAKRGGLTAFSCGLVASLGLASSSADAFPAAGVASHADRVSAAVGSQVVRVDADAKAGRKRIVDGVKAFEKNQYDKAIASFSAALRSGGLASQDMAKAMYFRGRAYEKANRPAEAIADLTSAIWLKDGLSEAERKDAEALRAKAYQSVGIAATPAARAPSSGGSSAPSAVARAPAAPPATVARSAPVQPAAPQAFTTRVAKAPPPAAAAPVPAFSTRTTQAPRAPQPQLPQAQPPRAPAIAPFSTTVANAPPPPAASKPAVPGSFATQVRPAEAAAPTRTAAAPPSSDSSSGTNLFSSIGSFFSGGLSGGSSSTAKPPASTASTAATGASTAVSGWSNAGPAVTGANAPLTAPRAAIAPSAPLPAASPPAAQVAAPSSQPMVTAALPREQAPAVESAPITRPQSEASANREVLVQVAAVRSRAEAERVAQRLVRNHGSDLGSRRPQIAEAVYGSMGTFYRVQVGPFAGDSETGDLCRALRGSGYDCLITPR